MTSRLFEVFATTPETIGLDEIVDYARRVEAIGFDGLFVPDAVHDGLLLACQALAATERIRVATSVLVAFPRSPMNVALVAWDLQRASGGRFELGLGTQIRQNVEQRYSARWLPPAAGMKEYVRALRAIFHSFRTGEPLSFVGQYYQFTRLQPFFNPGPIEEPDVPLALGAVGPRMLALVGSDADGLHTHPTNTSPRYLREVILPTIESGVGERSADLAKPFVAASVMVATGPDTDTVAKERERFREALSYLFSTPAYWRSLELFGWRDVGEQLQEMTREKRWKEMAGAIDDTMLNEFVVTALYEDVAESLGQRFVGLVDRLAIPVPADAAHDELAAEVVPEVRRLGRRIA